MQKKIKNNSTVMNENKNIEFIETRKEIKEMKLGSMRELIDGSFLTRAVVLKQLPFILFLTFLAIIYIGNRYQAERMIREKVALQTELKELRAKAITISADLMYISKQSQVHRLIRYRNLGLEESRVPPRIILMKKE
ncbi:MAG: FtsL-like putative cell division protein [Bacteroidota bacterium]